MYVFSGWEVGYIYVLLLTRYPGKMTERQQEEEDPGFLFDLIAVN